MALGIIIIISLILLGVALIMAEIFLLPGISIAGFAGGIFMVGSIVYAFYYMNSTTGYITIVANIIICSFAFLYLIKSNALDRIALKTDIESKVDQSDLLQLKEGQKGTTLSRLNPIGKGIFGDIAIEVKSFSGEFIDTEQAIVIVKIDGNNVLVRNPDEYSNSI